MRKWRLGKGGRFRFRRRRLTNIAILPTLVTLGNLVCGMLALFHISKGRTDLGAWFILGGMIFDALDGRVARITKTASSFGAQLDSLCDLVTFGVAPAFLVYSQCDLAILGDGGERIVRAVCVFYAVGAAVRLARFNVETTTSINSHMDFAGLPSPAAGGLVAASAIPWKAFGKDSFLMEISEGLISILPFVILLLAVLMLSRIRYVHVLNQLFRRPKPFFVFVEFALIMLLAAVFREFAIFLAFLAYAVSGPVLLARNRLTAKKPEPDDAPKPQREEPIF